LNKFDDIKIKIEETPQETKRTKKIKQSVVEITGVSLDEFKRLEQYPNYNAAKKDENFYVINNKTQRLVKLTSGGYWNVKD